MPEFVMPMGDTAPLRPWSDLDAFTRGYIEAMFFTSTGHSEDEDLEDATYSELAPETLERIDRDCAEFNRGADAWLHKAYLRGSYDMEQAGSDLWYTRCGHGVGFWDRGLGETGDRLSDLARAMGNVDLYRGDDGLLYVA